MLNQHTLKPVIYGFYQKIVKRSPSYPNGGDGTRNEDMSPGESAQM